MDENILDDIISAIDNIENAQKTTDITNIKKMKGHKHAFRIRIGNYRIGIFLCPKI